MEKNVIIGLIIGLIVLSVLIYFLGVSLGIFDNIIKWFGDLIQSLS